MKNGMTAILGSGPAGLMAAHAAALLGQPIVILSNTSEPSRLGGAQFLHKPIPEINDHNVPDRMITYRVRGDEGTYRRKVYGDGHVSFTSFANVRDGERQPAWNLIETYEKLWDMFSPHINIFSLSSEWADEAVKEFSNILSTVPAPALCRRLHDPDAAGHGFTSQRIIVDTSGEFARDVPDDTIIYDGTEDCTWYRSSRLFGVTGTEWSAHTPAPPLPDLITDSKPIATNCSCYPEITRLGRRGTWTKGVLTHDAFYEAAKLWMPERDGQ